MSKANIFLLGCLNYREQMKSKLILMMALICALPIVPKAEKLDYQCLLKKTEDSEAITNHDLRTMFVISSESGIGNVSITLPDGKWPKYVSFRFQYINGEGFGSLESISLTTERLQVSGSIKESGNMRFYLSDNESKFDSTVHFAGYLDIKVKHDNDAIEVTLPANLLVGTNEVKIGWIDAFR